MKISVNWLKEYIDFDLTTEQLADILTDLGLEVEGIEGEDVGASALKGVVVGEVITCEKHPNADKLSLTTVDVGQEAILQIVCGAPNVAKGQKVLVATVGANLTTSDGTKINIKKGKIRGEVSEGMICAADELGLSDDHSGIMVLDASIAVGTPATVALDLKPDTTIEIGLTPNRSDATNHIGVAQDLAAKLSIAQQRKIQAHLPNVDSFKAPNGENPIKIEVKNVEACPRYSALLLEGVSVGDSPDWLKKRLESIGVRSINNVVDITNFVLYEIGQPLHAFDADKIAGERVIVQTLPQGTKFVSLDAVERSLFAEDLMICDAENKPMCIGGVFGGISSGVTENTTRIFLESAHFNPKFIRRSSMKHNLRTDAAKCFEKGSDPSITVYALKRAALLICELTGAHIASDITDIYPDPIAKKKVKISYSKINDLIGDVFDNDKIHDILHALSMDIVEKGEDTLTVEIPTNKADVWREADVIEEILRIYGFNQVPIPQQIRSTISFTAKQDEHRISNIIADMLVSNGFVETMAMSITSSKHVQPFNISEEQLVFINNTSNMHLDIMRPDMLISGLETIAHNQNRQQTDLKLFEFGRTYTKKSDTEYEEKPQLAIYLTGNKHSESWIHKQRGEEATFFTLKAYIHLILQRLGIKDNFQEENITDTIFSKGVRYYRGSRTLLRFGIVNATISKHFDVKQTLYYACLDWDSMIAAMPKTDNNIKEPSKFPTVRRDLALVLPKDISFAQIKNTALKLAKKNLKEVNLFDVYENEESLGKDKKSYAVSYLFEDTEKTLKDTEIDDIIGRLVAAYEHQLGAYIRK